MSRGAGQVQQISSPPVNASAFLTTAGLPAVVYVSPAGDDTTGERGNQARPFATVAAALAASSAGDELELAPGNYAENVDLAAYPNRSVRGHGSRVTKITGTFGCRPTATGDISVQFAGFETTGTFDASFDNRASGSARCSCVDLVIGGNATFRSRNGALDQFIVVATVFKANITAVSLGAQLTLTACRIDGYMDAGESVVFAGACEFANVYQSSSAALTLAGCFIRENIGAGGTGSITTTGCRIAGAITIDGSVTWTEYGCTFSQASVSGASGNKRVSFQRIPATTIAVGTTTINLPIGLGSTSYHVTATPTNADGARAAVFVHNKTATSFDVDNNGTDPGDVEFGVFYRA